MEVQFGVSHCNGLLIPMQSNRRKGLGTLVRFPLLPLLICVTVAPNTGSFTATTSGMIEYVRSVNYTDGMHQRTAYSFIKIGSNVDPKVREEIERLYKDTIMHELGISAEHNNTVTDDDVQFNINGPSGSNWGGIGLVAVQL
jgi:hypothetical protein